MSQQGKKGGKEGPDQGSARPSERTLVIIPTFNELENLPLIMGRVHKALPDVHILVVDDGSPDGTGELADELALADPDRVHVMHRDAKDGLGAAYLLTKRAEQKGTQLAITPGKGMQLGVMVVGLVRSILSLGED